VGQTDETARRSLEVDPSEVLHSLDQAVVDLGQGNTSQRRNVEQVISADVPYEGRVLHRTAGPGTLASVLLAAAEEAGTEFKVIVDLEPGTYKPSSGSSNNSTGVQLVSFVLQGRVELRGNGSAVFACDPWQQQAGLSLWASSEHHGVDALIRDVEVRDCLFGLLVPGSVAQANVTLNNVNVTRCGGNTSSHASALAVYADNTRLRVQRSNLVNNRGKGIYIMAANVDVDLQESKVDANSGTGIVLRAASQSRLGMSGSSVQANNGTGLMVVAVQNASVALSQCQISSNGKQGLIVLDSRNVVVSLDGSSFVGNAEHGVAFWTTDSTTVSMTSSRCADNELSGLTMWAATGDTTLSLAQSHLVGNLVAALRVVDSDRVSATAVGVTMRETSGSAIIFHSSHGNLAVEDSTISHNLGVGIDFDDTLGSLVLTNSSLLENGRAMELRVAKAEVKDATFVGNGQAVTVRGDTQASLARCGLWSNVYGLRAFDSATVTFADSVIVLSHVGMRGSDRASILVEEVTVAKSWLGADLTGRSQVTLNGVTITDNAEGMIVGPLASVKFGWQYEHKGVKGVYGNQNFVYLNEQLDVGCGDAEALKMKQQKGLTETLLDTLAWGESCATYEDTNVVLRMHFDKLKQSLWWQMLTFIFFFNLPVLLDPETDSIWRYPSQTCRLSIFTAAAALGSATLLVVFLVFGIWDMLWARDSPAGGPAAYTQSPLHLLFSFVLWYGSGLALGVACRLSLETAKHMKRTTQDAIGNLEEEAKCRKQNIFAELDRYTKSLEEEDDGDSDACG